ncbi:MAG TPA: hypothetical protein VEK07_05060 [Polyangiaceae bacterium]|nr:hypothetical protein [Polyangiaceae bacterium]
MRGSIPTGAVVLAVFFGWSLVTSTREWLGTSMTRRPTTRERLPTPGPRISSEPADPRVNTRGTPAMPGGWLN